MFVASTFKFLSPHSSKCKSFFFKTFPHLHFFSPTSSFKCNFFSISHPLCIISSIRILKTAICSITYACKFSMLQFNNLIIDSTIEWIHEHWIQGVKLTSDRIIKIIYLIKLDLTIGEAHPELITDTCSLHRYKWNIDQKVIWKIY